MLTKVRIQNLLKKYQLRPKKHFGQNFLIDQKVIKRMIETADIQKQDAILEIGPGLGALTEKLVAAGAQIIAVEKDKELVKILKERFNGTANLKIIQGDIRSPSLTLPLKKGKGGIKVIANLPFYLTAPVIRQFLETPNPPQLMVFLIQKQVAQRICAKPPRMNLLAVSVQFYSRPKIISYVSKKSFWPQPEVDGAIICIKPTPSDSPPGQARGRLLVRGRTDENPPLGKGGNGGVFFKIVKAGFTHPRKKLINNLSKKLNIKKQDLEKIFQQLKIHEKARAENLDLTQWRLLSKQLAKTL